MRKKKKSKVQSSLRSDGWSNILTNLGRINKDKLTAAKIDFDFLDQETLESLYQSDGLAARIVDRPADEMLRKGFSLEIKEDPGDLGTQTLERAEDFNLKEKITQALTEARLYGGAGIVVGIKGESPEEPLNLNSIREIEYLTVTNRHLLQCSGSIQNDVTKPNFGYPEFYQISAGNSADLSKIHHSRVIRFEAVKLPYHIRQKNGYWGDSVLSRLYNAIRNSAASHDAAAVLIQDFSQAVFKLKNLSDMLAQGDDALVTKRLGLVSLLSSVVNAVVIQDDEEFERKTTSVAGLADMLRAIDGRLVSLTDMPHTILLGESAGGLGSTGDSEKRDWYDHLSAKQITHLKPQLNQLMDIFLAEQAGPAKGKLPEKYEVKFHPLWEMSQKETVETRKSQAEADQIYIQNGVLDQDEVAKARFGSGEYSIETQIDMASRQEFEEKTKVNPNENLNTEGDGEPIQT